MGGRSCRRESRCERAGQGPREAHGVGWAQGSGDNARSFHGQRRTSPGILQPGRRRRGRRAARSRTCAWSRRWGTPRSEPRETRVPAAPVLVRATGDALKWGPG